MRGRSLNILAKIRASMWLLPALMAFVAVAAAVTIAIFQSRITVPESVGRHLFSGEPSGARAILGAIAGSMIGVTGVVFSITIVALALASGQFGPRLLRNFMRDRSVQAVLGTFIATFAFSLVALRSISDREKDGGGYLFVVIGVILALASIGVLIFFIHHIATAIQAETVIENVARELSQKIDRLYPETVGTALAAHRDFSLPDSFEETAYGIRAARDGYIQSLDADAVLDFAMKHDLVIVFDRRPGHFVAKGHVVMRAWPGERIDAAIDADLVKTAIIGPHRTAEEDVEFLVEQLVEIAVRALSPGINDPFTAIACIDRLGAALSGLSDRAMPSPWRADAAGTLRVVVDRPSFEGIVENAFNQVRQFGASSVAVTIRILENLAMLTRVNAADPARMRVLQEQADRVHRSSRLTEHEPQDAREIDAAYARVHAGAV